MIKCAIFDLDGTLVNTIDDLSASSEYLLHKYNFNASWNIDDYKNFVGNGAKVLIKKAFANTLSDDEINKRFEEFKVYYDEHKLDNAYVYDGIKEQLDILKDKGIKLCVVTNKPHIAAVKMVEHFFGKNYFLSICGNKKELPRKPDPTSTLNALELCDCDKSEALYFGDSDVDMLTAKNAKIKAVGVCWGYRSEQILKEYCPYKLLKSTAEISKLF